MRDFQRARVYRAEDYLKDRWMDLGNIPNCINYAEGLWEHGLFRARYPKAHDLGVPFIVAGKGHRAHAYWPPKERITLPEWARNDYILLHEIAHIVCEREFDHDGQSKVKHGPQWCDAIICLSEICIGKEFAVDLVEAFLIEGVKFTPINKACGITMAKNLMRH